MAAKHFQLMLDSNTLGASHFFIDKAIELLEDMNHPLAAEFRQLNSELLDSSVEKLQPLMQYLYNLPEDVDF